MASGGTSFRLFRTVTESEERSLKKNRSCVSPQSVLLHYKIKKISGGTHTFPTTILKNSDVSHQNRLHVFKHTNRDCFPFRFYFNTNKCMNTLRQDSRTSRTTTSVIWSSRVNISSSHILPCIRINSSYSVVFYLLWNLSNNHHFLVTPYSCQSIMWDKDLVSLSL